MHSEKFLYNTKEEKLQGLESYKLKEKKLKIIRDQFPTSLGLAVVGSSTTIVGSDGVASFMVGSSMVTSLVVASSTGVASDIGTGAILIGALGMVTPSKGSSSNSSSFKKERSSL